MKIGPAIYSEPGKNVEKKEDDKDNMAGAVASKRLKYKGEKNIAPPTENTTEPASPPPSPAKVEVKIETVSALGGTHEYTNALHAQLLDLEKAKHVEKLPHIVVQVAEDDDITVEIIVIVSFADTSDKLIHSANFILEAVDTTTLMEIKKKLSKVLDVRYEDMSIACGRRFLSDCRSLYYYAIFSGVTIHLLVDSPDEIFINVFPALVNRGHNEGIAAIATRTFVGKMNTKYHLDEGDNPILTQELLMFELGLFHVPNGYDSDLTVSSDSSDEEDSIDLNEYPPSVFHIGELELLMMKEEEEFAENNQILNENLIIENLQDDYVNEDDENSENDNAYLHNEEENAGDVDSSDEEDYYESDWSD